jgi:hypothetical protein
MSLRHVFNNMWVRLTLQRKKTLPGLACSRHKRESICPTEGNEVSVRPSRS